MLESLVHAAQIDIPEVKGINETFDKAAELEKLGMTALAKKTLEAYQMKEKYDILACLKEYPRITLKMIDEYCDKISRKATSKANHYISIRYHWEEVLLSEYDKYPPQDVLDKLDVARGLDLFDEFVIAYLKKEHTKVPDPLLLGIINGSTDRFVIAQWDDDIDLDVLLGFGK